MSGTSNKIEQAFLREIAANPRDNTARLVYADWLDEVGDPRGEFLRVHCELSNIPPTDARYQVLWERERELQAGCNPDWLRQVGQPRIENCDVSHSGLEFAYECPLAWNELDRTDDISMRHCNACAKDVYFCSDLGHARFYAGLGYCVALDPSLVRRERDLEPSQTLMGVLRPPQAQGSETPTQRRRNRNRRRSRNKSE